MNLQIAAQRILEHGPRRVVVNEDGEAYSPQRAKTVYRIDPDIIFIREDGWSLGAPTRFEKVAKSLWAGQWIGFLLKGETEPRPLP